MLNEVLKIYEKLYQLVWKIIKIKEHQQETSILLGRFWSLGRVGLSWLNPLKKTIRDGNIFPLLATDNDEWSSKNLWTMISAGVKTNKEKTRNKRPGASTL